MIGIELLVKAKHLEYCGIRFDGISGDGCYDIAVLYEEPEESSISGDYTMQVI